MKMRAIILSLVFAFFATSAVSYEVTNNDALKGCLALNGYTPDKFDQFDFSKSASCFLNFRAQRNAEQLAELRDFLKHNPRYRFPGQSLNKCWGKPREMPFESAGIETNGNSMRAWVNYKDKLPAGCYENAPWDNRDVED